MKISRAERPVIAITAILIALILIGEIYVYTVNPNDMYASSCVFDDDGIKYSVSSTSSNQYSVVVTEGGESPDGIYIYYDESYESTAVAEKQPIGSKPLTEKYYLKQLEKQLANRGVKVEGWLNAEELKNFMAGNYDAGLIMASGSIPSNVYDGQNDDGTFINWIKSGGSLYWVGGLLGKTVSEKGYSHPAADDYQSFFFDGKCLNETDENIVTDDYEGNDFRHSLCLMNNRVKYGLEFGKSLGMGYCSSKYVSSGLVKCGDGMICIMAGDYTNNQRADLAQIIAAGLTPETDEVDVDTGTVTRTMVNGTIDATGPNLKVYIYLGGYYVVYGKCYSN